MLKVFILSIFVCASLAADPYLWLEEMHSPQTKSWLAEQESHADEYFATTDRDACKALLGRFHDYETLGVPYKQGGKLFYIKDAKLYVDGQLIVEPPEGWAFSGFVPSPDSKYIAYGLHHHGSDWQYWFVCDITGQQIDGPIKWIKFHAPVWGAEGLYYSAFLPPKEELSSADTAQELRYHPLFQPIENDAVLTSLPDGRIAPLYVWKDQLIVSMNSNAERENGIGVLDPKHPKGIQEVVPAGRGIHSFLGVVEGNWLFLTDRDAPMKQIVAIDPNDPSDQRVIVPEMPFPLLEAHLAGGKLVAVYLVDVVSEVWVFDLEGKLEAKLDLPGPGTVSRPWKGVHLRGNPEDSELFVPYTDMIQPVEILSYDLNDLSHRELLLPGHSWDKELYTVTQTFIQAKDGTRIPLFFLHRKEICPGPDTPTLLYGYGGFGLCLSPYYSPLQLAFADAGGVVVLAVVRGGGEYGQAWHEAGMLDRKQTVFDDFQTVGEWLIRNDKASVRHLAIYGRSNGGLLVGTCMTQRPELYRAAVVGVGVLDMLRFHLYTCGAQWIKEYGSPEVPEEAAVLHRYSPYHQVKEGLAYPATLIITADHDDRVVPFHSYKFAAKLMECSKCSPVILQVEKGTGHSGGENHAEALTEEADILSFLMKELSG